MLLQHNRKCYYRPEQGVDTHSQVASSTKQKTSGENKATRRSDVRHWFYRPQYTFPPQCLYWLQVDSSCRHVPQVAVNSLYIPHTRGFARGCIQCYLPLVCSSILRISMALGQDKLPASLPPSPQTIKYKKWEFHWCCPTPSTAEHHSHFAVRVRTADDESRVTVPLDLSDDDHNTVLTGGRGNREQMSTIVRCTNREPESTVGTLAGGCSLAATF